MHVSTGNIFDMFLVIKGPFSDVCDIKAKNYKSNQPQWWNWGKDCCQCWGTQWLKVALAHSTRNYAEWTETFAWRISCESDAWHLVIITINDSVSSEWLTHDETLWLLPFWHFPGVTSRLITYFVSLRQRTVVAQPNCFPCPNSYLYRSACLKL